LVNLPVSGVPGALVVYAVAEFWSARIHIRVRVIAVTRTTRIARITIVILIPKDSGTHSVHTRIINRTGVPIAARVVVINERNTRPINQTVVIGTRIPVITVFHVCTSPAIRIINID
jgi:hypothetical protein